MNISNTFNGYEKPEVRISELVLGGFLCISGIKTDVDQWGNEFGDEVIDFDE